MQLSHRVKALETSARLESLDRARLIDQINVLTSESYGINLCHCSNEKVTNFMFAFKGPIFLEGMMHNKIEEMQFGVLRDDVKYCVVRLFQRNIRCAKHLSNLVHGTYGSTSKQHARRRSHGTCRSKSLLKPVPQNCQLA